MFFVYSIRGNATDGGSFWVSVSFLVCVLDLLVVVVLCFVWASAGVVVYAILPFVFLFFLWVYLGVLCVLCDVVGIGKGRKGERGGGFFFLREESHSFIHSFIHS